MVSFQYWGRRGGAWIWLASLICAMGVFAEDDQQQSSGMSLGLPEMVVVATRTPRSAEETPWSLSIIDRDRMDELASSVALDALRYEPGVFIEKRTTTTSDPIMRGFAGRNILTLIDGNTLTTLWGEGGDGADDMYGKIDPDTVERIEVIRGPASVLYGSNAVGGVINFVSRRPAVDFTDGGMATAHRLKTVYGSAAQEVRGRGELHLALPTFRMMLGGSIFDTDDVRGGGSLGALSPSDGEGKNYDVAMEMIPFGPEHLFFLTYQDTHLTHAKRYYRADQDNFNDREAAALSYVNTAENVLWERLELDLYYQYKEDRRRWLAGADAGQRGVAKTKTLSADLQMTRTAFSRHRLTWGVHFERTSGESPDDEQFTITAPGLNGKQKGAPDTDWENTGIFLQDEFDLTDSLSLIAAVRYDWFYFNSDPDEHYTPPSPGQDPQLDNVGERKGVFSGGAGLLYRCTDNLNAFVNYSRGFRLTAPNFGVRLLSDLGYLVPNDFLDPITADQFEVGLKTWGDGYSGSVSYFTTEVQNQQTNVFGTFNGLTWYDEDGDGVEDANELPILQTVSGEDATIRGVELQAELALSTLAGWLGNADALGRHWSIHGCFAWEFGRDGNTGGPVRWVHPTYGCAALRYDRDDSAHPFWVEFSARFARQFDRVSRSRLGDPAWREEPQDRDSGLLRDYLGVPGYTVLDLRGGVALSDHVQCTLAIENLTDKKYRSAHSRTDAPGINVVIGLDFWF